MRRRRFIRVSSAAGVMATGVVPIACKPSPDGPAGGKPPPAREAAPEEPGAATPPASEPSAAGEEDARSMLTREIPHGGEHIPVIGLGTSRTFDVGTSDAELAPLIDVMRKFIDAGGRVIDSSPMYGEAERVVGDLLERTGNVGKPWLATKVWTEGRQEGIDQMNESFRLMRTEKIDLMQVHNLVDTQTHLPTLREWKQEGRIGHIGITHMRERVYPEIEELMKKENLDFIQIPYSIGYREVERRILPVARDTGTAVLVMRPFMKGELFEKVKGKPLPDLARELEIESWAQFFLKWLLGHPAVTCPIPATSKVKHLEDNVRAGYGPIPDARMREKMVEAVFS